MGKIIDRSALFGKRKDLNEFLEENPQYRELYRKIEDKLPPDADKKLALMQQVKSKHMELLGSVFKNLQEASQELSENLQKLSEALEDRQKHLEKLRDQQKQPQSKKPPPKN